ncbi:hypothetical protein [Kutzneria sp. NPDC052558]
MFEVDALGSDFAFIGYELSSAPAALTSSDRGSTLSWRGGTTGQRHDTA